MGQQVGHQEHRPAGASADAWKQRAPDVVEGASGRLVEGAADVVDARQQRHDAQTQRQHDDWHFEVKLDNECVVDRSMNSRFFLCILAHAIPRADWG